MVYEFYANGFQIDSNVFLFLYQIIHYHQGLETENTFLRG